MFRSSNPVLQNNSFRVVGVETAYSGTMTIKGTAIKGLFLLSLVVFSALWTWRQFFTSHSITAIYPYIMIGFIGGFICALVTTFKKEWAGYTAPLYALLEGLAIGGISAFFEMRYPGIAIQASSLTFATFAVMFGLYSSGAIRVTDKMRMGITAAVGGIALIYFISMILSFFGSSMNFLLGSGPVGILFSLFVVGIAAFSLLLDFDVIEQGVRAGAPKYMEWYGAFGVMVTLIWLYMEILRLLSKLRGNRRH